MAMVLCGLVRLNLRGGDEITLCFVVLGELRVSYAADEIE